MSEFMSTVKTQDKNGKDKYYFLTHDLIHNTPRGEMIQRKYPGAGEVIGHSAIREYFEIRAGQGENWECTDFSSPDKFPTAIAKAIRRGEFRGFGTPAGLLSDTTWKQYDAVVDTAFWDLFADPNNRAEAWR